MKSQKANLPAFLQADSAPKLICAPFDFGQKAKAAEMARRIAAECAQSFADAEASKDKPARKASASGQRSGSKRASIKRAWLMDAGKFAMKPSDMLHWLDSIGIESTESSIASIRSDLRACMLAIGAENLEPSFTAMLANAKGLRSNDPLAFLNSALFANPAMERKAAIELLRDAGFNSAQASDSFIGGSLAASKESIAILAEMGAFEKSAELLAA